MFDLSRFVFSGEGNYLLLDRCDGGLVLASSYGGKRRNLYRMQISGEIACIFTPWELKVRAGESEYAFTFTGKNGLLVKGRGEPLALEYTDLAGVYNVNFVYGTEKGVCVGDTLSNGRTYFTARSGKVSYDAPMNIGKESRKFYAKREYLRIFLSAEEGGFCALIEQSLCGELPACCGKPFREQVLENKRRFQSFAEPFIQKDKKFQSAAYILWSNTAVKEGYFTRQPVLCSKAGMTRVWSWDNVFNALALAEFYPEKALDQFMIPYDLLSQCGQMPDAISATTVEWTNVKPPVQGWAYQIMQKLHPFFREKAVLNGVYFAMRRNTDWWLNQNGGIPLYYHGNDSGCDNATCFDGADCIASPDLAAFLSVQCGFLASAASELGFSADARRYAQEEKRLAELACGFFDGRIFVRDGITGEKYYSDALMPLRVLVLGKKLPIPMRAYIAGRLEKDFLSGFGLASEALSSEKYMKDGYWRGSIWNPDQYMFYHALREIGERELAEKIIQNYRRAIEKSGFYENYDAYSGEGERVKSFSWPVSSFLLK